MSQKSYFPGFNSITFRKQLAELIRLTIVAEIKKFADNWGHAELYDGQEDILAAYELIGRLWMECSKWSEEEDMTVKHSNIAYSVMNFLNEQKELSKCFYQGVKERSKIECNERFYKCVEEMKKKK